MRRARTGWLPILWGAQPPRSEVLRHVRQQPGNGRIDRAISPPDDGTWAAVVIIGVLR